MSTSAAPFLVPSRLDEILARIPKLRIAVLGDFFLDKYLVTDPALSERSIETGLEARQVVDIRCSPGAAGTITNNLGALGVGRVDAVGVIGDDGEGFELRRGLEAAGVGTSRLIRSSARFTPTYIKPMVQGVGPERELERMDIKNRSALSDSLQEEVVAGIVSILASETADAVIIADQVQERNCGVVTDHVRTGLCNLAKIYPQVTFFADSRCRIGEFQGVTLKPNQHEAAQALGREASPDEDPDRAASDGVSLAKRSGSRVFLTVGDQGILVCTAKSYAHLPTISVHGPIDIVGAGDSATAGIVCALCAGAKPEEAAMMGNLCASVTIRKLGTTGTASPHEVREMLARVNS